MEVVAQAMFAQEVPQQLLQIVVQLLVSFREMQDLIFQPHVLLVTIVQLVLHIQFRVSRELIKPQQVSLLVYHALLENIEMKQELQQQPK